MGSSVGTSVTVTRERSFEGWRRRPLSMLTNTPPPQNSLYRDHVYPPLQMGHTDGGAYRSTGSLSWALGADELAQFTVYKTDSGKKSLQFCTDTRKGVDFHIVAVPSSVQRVVILEWSDYILEHHPEMADLPIKAEDIVEWMQADHGDPGFELLISHFLTGMVAAWKLLRTGLNLQIPAMVFAGLKELLDWMFARNMRKYGPETLRYLADLVRCAACCGVPPSWLLAPPSPSALSRRVRAPDATFHAVRLPVGCLRSSVTTSGGR